jgi:hypothetical protein
MPRALFVMVSVAVLSSRHEPGGCGSAPGTRQGTPPPASEARPALAPTTPPAWTSPDNAGPLAVPSPPASINPELAKARASAQAGDSKKVRAALEKKLKAGKISQEEAALLADACVALRDRACVDAVRARFPEL